MFLDSSLIYFRSAGIGLYVHSLADSLRAACAKLGPIRSPIARLVEFRGFINVLV